MCWAYFKNIGRISKKFGPFRKTLCLTWCHKLVTYGILIFLENMSQVGFTALLKYLSFVGQEQTDSQ